MKIRPSRLSDWQDICRNLSLQSYDELSATPGAFVAVGIDFQEKWRSNAITFEHDGQPVALFWLSAPSEDGTRWTNLVCAKSAYENKIRFVQAAKDYLRQLRCKIGVYVMSEHPQAKRWVEMFGFDFESQSPVGYFNLR